MNTFQEQLMAIKTDMIKEELKSDNKIIETKVEVKSLDINKQIKQVKIEVNTNDKNVHNDVDKNVVVSKMNYNKYNQEAKKSQRMQIWYVNLGKKNGSVQGGIRPCLISSNSVNNQFATIRNVFPITSQDKNNLPVHVSIEGYGLEEKSTILTEQITTIDVRYDLMYYVGTIDEITMRLVDKARNIQLGDMVEKTLLEKLPRFLREKIEEKLDDIYTYEKAISKSKNESLINNLLEQREAFLWSLQKFCEDNKLNYRDYYKKYEVEKEMVAM